MQPRSAELRIATETEIKSPAQANRMLDKLGISTWSCVSLPIERCLAAIRKAGFRRIEVWGNDPSHFDLYSQKAVVSLRDQLLTTDFIIESIHAPFGSSLDISSPDSSTRQNALSAMFRCLEVSAELSAHAIVLHPGNGMRVGEEPRRYEMAAMSLAEICSKAQDADVEVCVENMASDEHNIAFCDTLPKTLHLVRSIEGFAPGICVDTSHANLTGNVAEEIEICGGSVRRTHISDNLGRKDDHMPPGDGHIDWNAVLASLRRISYRGSLMLEVAGGPQPSEVLSRARSNAVRVISQRGG